jgi:hypothetical protein
MNDVRVGKRLMDEGTALETKGVRGTILRRLLAVANERRQSNLLHVEANNPVLALQIKI